MKSLAPGFTALIIGNLMQEVEVEPTVHPLVSVVVQEVKFVSCLYSE